MVVSTILLTALAPITGALFGASYGTSIRIGYEIIFPALFGDLLKEQNKRLASGSPQQEGAKLTIQALHKMFTATGGVSAMEFGISQGIEMAKKKTESTEVQHLISLNLGITEEQLKRKHKFDKGHTTETDAEKEQRELEESEQTEDFLPDEDETQQVLKEYKQMKKNYPNDKEGNSRLFKNFNNPNYFGELNKSQRLAMIKLYFARENTGAFKHDTFEEATEKATGGTENLVFKIASMYNELKRALLVLVFPSTKNKTALRQNQLKSQFYIMTKAFNRFVAKNGKLKLQIDADKSIKSKKMVGK